MKKINRNAGFTLAELLIVIAVIAALVAIAVMIISDKVEKANQAVDMSTMRAAYSELMMKQINGEVETGQRYIYNPSNTGITTMSMDRPATGYGKSKTDASKWWTGMGTASGVPCGSTASVLQMWVDENGEPVFHWGGKYSGLNVTSQEEYNRIAQENPKTTVTKYNFGGKTYSGEYLDVFVEKDKVLLDALQEEFRGMTYSEIYNLIYDENGKRRSDIEFGNTGGMACIVIGYGAVTKDGAIGDGKNKITAGFEDIFMNSGFDTDQDYLINSVPMTGTKTNRIWVSLGVSEGDLKKNKNSDKVAGNAFTYVKSDEEATPNDLRWEIRKNK